MNARLYTFVSHGWIKWTGYEQRLSLSHTRGRHPRPVPTEVEGYVVGSDRVTKKQIGCINIIIKIFLLTKIVIPDPRQVPYFSFHKRVLFCTVLFISCERWRQSLKTL